MPDPDFEADPESEPYRVLGVAPTDGADTYRTKDGIEQRAKDLIVEYKAEKEQYRCLQLAMKRALEITPSGPATECGAFRCPSVSSETPLRSASRSPSR